MDTSLCKLTLVYPLASEVAIIEGIQKITPELPGFTSWTADGHGHAFENASVSERVRGRVRRGVLVMVVPRDTAKTVLATIASDTPVLHITYWIEPVEEAGQLTVTNDTTQVDTLSLEQTA